MVTVFAVMLAAVGLLTSLREFGIWMAVAAAGVCAQGLVTFVEDRREVRAYRKLER